MNSLLYIGRGTYLNKNNISHYIRWAKTQTTPGYYSITMKNRRRGQMFKIYENEPQYKDISEYLKEQLGSNIKSQQSINYVEFAERGQNWGPF